MVYQILQIFSNVSLQNLSVSGSGLSAPIQNKHRLVICDRPAKNDLGCLKDWAHVVYQEEGQLIQTN